MKKGAGIEKMQEDMAINIIGIDSPESVKHRLCHACKLKFEKYTSGDHSDDQLCGACTTIIQSMLGDKLL